MNMPVILCVDDQREVLAAIAWALEPLEDHFEILEAERGDEAMALLGEFDAAGRPVALVIADHVMPGLSGVALLAAVDLAGRYKATRKVLLTGQATHEDTIRAINEARINRYVAKPWEEADLQQVVREELTHYVLEAFPDRWDAFRSVLDGAVMLACMRERGEA